MSTTTHPSQEPFLTHLLALFSLYELGPPPVQGFPVYQGPKDWQTEAIERSLKSMARRMYTAESELSNREDLVPDSKKRRKGSASSSASSGSTRSSVESSGHVVETAQTSVNGNGNDAKAHKTSPMTISLSDLTPIVDHRYGPAHSAPTTTSDYLCPACGRRTTLASTSGPFPVFSPSSSPLAVPCGPLVAAAYESGMSAVEELNLLKAQVQDVARVCKAVALGDLSQKITVPVHGAVMVQLKDVINTMVDKLGQFAKEVTRVSHEVGSEGYVSF